MSQENLSQIESKQSTSLVEITSKLETPLLSKSKNKTKRLKSMVKKPTLSPSTSPKKKKQRRTKHRESYSLFIFRVLKQVHPELSISSKSMSIMNSFVEDLFDRIAEEAAKLSNLGRKGKTISGREIQSAVRLVLPGDLAKHAISEGTKALNKFSNSK